MCLFGCCFSKLKSNEGLSIFSCSIIGQSTVELGDRDEIFGFDLTIKSQILKSGLHGSHLNNCDPISIKDSLSHELFDLLVERIVH